MKTYIYGAGKAGQAAIDILKKEGLARFGITGVIDQKARGMLGELPIFAPQEIAYEDARVVIAIMRGKIAIEIYSYLYEQGCRNIWWFDGKKEGRAEEFFSTLCVDCQKWENGVLHKVEMHIMDNCNLNCKGCTHFSPIFGTGIPDMESRLRDVRILKEKVGCIMNFFILGGEPFLNPQIAEYVEGIRDILMDSNIWIVTNGLLIPKIDRKVLETIRDNHVRISISEYMPTHKNREAIEECLQSMGITYQIRRLESKVKFNLPLSLSDHTVHPKLCISDGCINIWNGKIARCPTLMYIESFNQYFGTELPSTGILSLEAEINGWDLVKEMKKEIPLCAHCIQNEIEWEVCGKDAKIEDFAVKD